MHPAYRRRRHARLLDDVLARQPLAAQHRDLVGNRGLFRAPLRPGGSVCHAAGPLAPETLDPAPNDLRRHAVCPRRIGYGKTAFDNAARSSRRKGAKRAFL